MFRLAVIGMTQTIAATQGAGNDRGDQNKGNRSAIHDTVLITQVFRRSFHHTSKAENGQFEPCGACLSPPGEAIGQKLPFDHRGRCPQFA